MVKKATIFSVLIFILFYACINPDQQKNDVIPIDRSTFTRGLPQDSISQRWQLILNRSCRKIFEDWWISNQTNGREGQYIDFGYLETNDKNGEFGKESKGGIRPAAQNAYTIAVGLFTGAYDASFVGISEETALLRSLTIIKSLAKDHLANPGIEHPWGNQWQSAQWASKTAISGWLLWAHLSATDQQYIKKMIVYEANRFLTKIPPSANENYTINTHAEENGWDGTGIQTACALMPEHDYYDAWFKKSIEYRLNALATPKDMHNDREIADWKVENWVHGYNLDTLGAVGNHKAYPHPDYMASPLRHTIEGALFLKLGKQSIPEANTFNCNIIYKNFVDHVWNKESTIYRPDGSIYWPIIIETDRRFEYITFGLIDAGAHILGYDDLASVKAASWEAKHTFRAIEMNLTGFAAATAYLFHWLNYQEKHEN